MFYIDCDPQSSAELGYYLSRLGYRIDRDEKCRIIIYCGADELRSLAYHRLPKVMSKTKGGINEYFSIG